MRVIGRLRLLASRAARFGAADRRRARGRGSGRGGVNAAHRRLRLRCRRAAWPWQAAAGRVPVTRVRASAVRRLAFALAALAVA